MNKLRKTLLLIAVLLAHVNAFAYDFEVEGLCYTILNEDKREVEVSKWADRRVSGELSIPSHISYNGKSYTVTAIGESALGGYGGITSVVIPNSVTTIGDNAFYCCSSLISVEIPYSVTKIGASPFNECKGLTSIELPNSVTTIGDYAFQGCNSLTSIELPIV